MDNRAEFIQNNMGLVHICAKRFKDKGIDYEDILQAGNLGLIKAVDNFDSTRKIKFSTYAIPCILGEIKQLFRANGSVKIGRNLKELSLKAKRVYSDYFSKHGKNLTVSKLAEILEISPEKVALALNAGSLPVSLTTFDSNDEENQKDIPSEIFDDKISDKIALNQIVNSLEKKDKAIITLRFFKNQTQTKTAEILGMSQVQVSRREKIILNNMKKKLIS